VKNVELGLVHSGVEGSDFSQSFLGELGMATKPGISVLAMNEDLAILTCVCVTKWFLQVPRWPTGSCKIGHHT